VHFVSKLSEITHKTNTTLALSNRNEIVFVLEQSICDHTTDIDISNPSTHPPKGVSWKDFMRSTF
jgi:hypothetical protein